MTKYKTREEIGYYLLIGRYFLFMYQQEWNFVKDDPMALNVKRANKFLNNAIDNYDKELKSLNVNHREVFAKGFCKVQIF